MLYSINRDKNIFTVSSTSTTNINVTLFKQELCSENTFIEVVPLRVSTSVKLKFCFGDGIYKILITPSSYSYFTQPQEIIIPYYETLVKSLSTEIENLLCGANCSDCKDCTGNPESTLLKMITYYNLTHANYCENFNKAFPCVKCLIEDANQCLLLNEKIKGNADNTKLLKETISYYFLLFFYTDNSNFDLKQSVKIINCIKKLGVPVDCIKNSIIVNEPYYTNTNMIGTI